jgi:uncharacterized phage protein (predicted DNA packaging)
MIIPEALLDKVKANLILQHSDDDELLTGFIAAAIDYAAKYQHVDIGYYDTNPLPPTTEQAVIMLASHMYEARDGSTAGFYGDSVAAAQQSMTAVNDLLRLDRIWGV